MLLLQSQKVKVSSRAWTCSELQHFRKIRYSASLLATLFGSQVQEHEFVEKNQGY